MFLQKLLRSHGFRGVGNSLFESYSLHFRNALVHACYRNVALGVAPNFVFLNAFVEGLLLNDATFPYRNRDMAAPELFEAKGMVPPDQESSGLVG